MVDTVNGMNVNETKMVLSPEQVAELHTISAHVDILVVPFPVLNAIKIQLSAEERDLLDSVVCFNATKETQRSAPGDKVIDTNNWSW